MSKPCPCGSGLPRHDLIDAHGIFCTYICDTCEPRKRATYNPAIFEHPYAADDLGSLDPDDEPTTINS